MCKYMMSILRQELELYTRLEVLEKISTIDE